MPTILPAKFDLKSRGTFVINGVSASDYSGYSVSTAGDVNGDGIADILIGAYQANQDLLTAAGTNYIIFGSTTMSSSSVLELSSLNGTNGFAIKRVLTGDGTGKSVSDAGDVNGDGFADILIGAFYASPGGRSHAGASYVIFGGPRVGSAGILELSSLNGSNGFAINGVAANDWSGYTISAAGDVNGDGFADMLIGAFYASPGGRSHAGISYIIFGGPTVGSSGVLELSSLNGSNGFAINGVTAGDGSGYSVSSAGDMNGDGFADILIGAPYRSYAGNVYVVFGGLNVGSSSVLELSSLNGSNGFTMNNVIRGYNNGYSVSAAGDVNGDGFADIIIGAPSGSVNNEAQKGISYVIFGGKTVGSGGVIALSSLNGINGFAINGVSANNLLYDVFATYKSGFSVSAAGDVNADGFADIIIAAYQGTTTTGTSVSLGASYIIFGGPSLGSGGVFELSSFKGTSLTSGGLVIRGITVYETTKAYSISAAGDVNGDGIADIIIGANQASPGNPKRLYAGTSYIIFGDETPQLLTNRLNITAGGSQLLTTDQLSAMTLCHYNNTLIFNPSSIEHGHFELVTNPGKPITSFIQQQITDGQVKFVHDGSESAPEYWISVSTGVDLALPSQPQLSNITFTGSTDLPISSSAIIGIIAGLLGGVLGVVGLAVALYYHNRRNKSHAAPSSSGSGITLLMQENSVHVSPSASTSQSDHSEPMQENPVHASSSASTSQSGHSDDVQKTSSYSSVGRNSLLHDTSVIAKGKTPAIVTFLSPEEKNDLQVLKQCLQRILTSDAGMLLPESLLFSAAQSENRIKQVAVLIQTWLAAEALKSVSLAQAGGKEFSEQDNPAQKNFEAIRAAIQNLIELVDKQAPDDAKPSVEVQAKPETEQSSRTQEHVNELRHLLTMVQSVCDILEGRRIRLLQPRLKS